MGVGKRGGAGSASRGTSRKTGSKPRKGRPVRSLASSSSRIRKFHSAQLAEISDDWDATVQQIGAGMASRDGRDRELPPFDRAESYLKREIYSFVCRYLDEGRAGPLKVVLENEGDLPRDPSFESNPFHWALVAMHEQTGGVKVRWKISRYGRQLAYARRHRIPPELLVGFLLQTGTVDQVYRKAGTDALEPWHASLRTRLKGEAQLT